MYQQLKSKIEKKQAIVAIVGLGYVGLPLASSFRNGGFKVVGFDIDGTKIEQLRQGKKYLPHISIDTLVEGLADESFVPTADVTMLQTADAIILCVPTPLGQHNDPDLSYIVNTVETLLPHLRQGQLLSLESTTYPGTTEEEIVSRVAERGFIVGEDFFVVYSPEREDPGNINYGTSTIPKVVGGMTEKCRELAVALYGQVVSKVVPVSTLKAAEMTKLLENIFRAVNIGLVNELKLVADKMGIDVWEVIDAAATKPFGFMPFYPGPGLGGHCIPIDPFYLTWKAREYGVHTRFIELAGEVNSNMPAWVVDKCVKALNAADTSVKNAKILICGLAYKKNVGDVRESPSVEIIELLMELGADVCYSDPHIEKIPTMRHHSISLDSVVLDEPLLRSLDCVVIATDHDVFDYDLIGRCAPLVIDTRGRYREPAANIVKA
ncbi:MAG: nucleotide sugar dehydrogenase [Spirochaetales bacterium]|jgi:UDP-N-acetyl-D-glucosamine dehydrogenase|nr:nucleotide sugar dehydrogenase [Spirochaetales bacterium]